MPKAEYTHIVEAKRRREALHQAMVGLEDALSTPIDDGARWRLRVTMAVDHARRRIDDHVGETEAPSGILAEVTTAAPRLHGRATRLRDDHEVLGHELQSLETALADLADDDVGRHRDAVRHQARRVLGLLDRHRQRGADLLYEAYQVDIGASH